MEQNSSLPDIAGLSEEEKLQLLMVMKRAKVMPSFEIKQRDLIFCVVAHNSNLQFVYKNVVDF